MNGAATDHRSLWFLNTYVTICISSRDDSDGISVFEHRASQGDSPPLHIHHDEDEIFHVLEGEVRYESEIRSTALALEKRCSLPKAFLTLTGRSRLRPACSPSPEPN